MTTDSSPFLIQNTNQRYTMDHGFLPNEDPLLQLPTAFSPLEKIACQLPKLLVSAQLHRQIETLPTLPIDQLTTGAELERAMMLLSYLGHAYVWQDATHPRDQLPDHLAHAWYAVAEKIGRPPILSYASYALYNWRRIDPQGPVELGNIALLQNFLGGIDEEWFILIHIDIEQRAIPALHAIQPAQLAIQQRDEKQLLQHLEHIATALNNIVKTLERMPEHCDPYIYYNRVRPYIHGWKNNPALPNGILYSGVTAYNNKPVKFKGETGAQSTIVPVLDALLGIAHAENPLKEHLQEMRQYMPPQHQQFLETIEQGPLLRPYIDDVKAHNPTLKQAYNRIIELLHQFRSVHIQYAAKYIQQQHQANTSNPTEVGTGGTPFMKYLHKHQTETMDFLIE